MQKIIKVVFALLLLHTSIVNVSEVEVIDYQAIELIEEEDIEPETEPEIIEEEDIIPEPELEWILPCHSSSVKTYMDYNAITLTTSKQYKYIREHMSIDNGLLYDSGGYMGVALGSWWGDIGSKWIIELDTGVILPVVKIDEKADQHVINGCQHRTDGSVIEVVVDSPTIPKSWWGGNGYVFNGNFNNSEMFKGNILRVAKPH